MPANRNAVLVVLVALAALVPGLFFGRADPLPTLAQPAGLSVCPAPGQWAMAVWLGADNTPTEQAAATCTETAIQVVWWLNPDTQEWEGYSLDPAVPAFARGSLTVVSYLQPLMLRGWEAAEQISATATPTPTPSPTPTPTPTPTPLPAGYSTARVSSYRDSLGALWVVGEAKNNTQSNVEFMKIIGTFYDAANNVVAVEFTYTCLDIVPAGGDSPFALLVLDAPDDIARYALTIEANPTSKQPPLGLELSGVTTRYDTVNAYHVLGEVRNRSNRTYEFVQVCGALYDQAGNTVRSSFTFTQPAIIAPGQAAPFDLYEFVGTTAIASYRLWVDGRAR